MSDRHRRSAGVNGPTKHAVVFGSLGLQNQGDDELLLSLIRWMNGCYDSITVIMSRFDGDLLARAAGATTSSVFGQLGPPWPTTRRPWRGWLSRMKIGQAIRNRAQGDPIHAYWIGGLLGGVSIHVRTRYRELKWARTMASRFVYFFGDVGTGFDNLPDARRWTRLAAAMDMNVTLRSKEAQDLLMEAGFHGKIGVGLDAVLYDRCAITEVPQRSETNEQVILALNPCIRDYAQMKPFWLAVAQAGHQLGFRIVWISTWDQDDLPVCNELRLLVEEQLPGIRQQVIRGRDAEAAFALARVAVTSRYHASIFAHAHGVPTIVYPYDVKVSRLQELLGFPDLIVHPDRVTGTNDLVGYVEALIQSALQGSKACTKESLRQEILRHQDVSTELKRSLGL